MAAVRLCRIDDVEEGCPVAVNVPGLPSLTVYKVGADYLVTDNLCTHGNGYLSDGYQEGEIIECPFHGGSFNIRSGKPASLPCTKPIKTYKATSEEGFVIIDV